MPTGVPLVYELDDALKPLRHYYLGDPEVAAKAAAAVAAQGTPRLKRLSGLLRQAVEALGGARSTKRLSATGPTMT